MEQNSISKNGFQLVSKYRSAIMGLAALWILVFHAWVILSPDPKDGSFSLINFLEHYIKDIGFCGVDIFLFLSGIGLTFAIRKESLPVFYYRRVRRVMLPFLTVGIVRGIVQNWGLPLMIANLTGYNFFMNNTYAFLWFVPAIVTLYLFFPLYYKLFEKAGNKILFTAGAVMVWLLIVLLARDQIRIDMFAFINRIPVFLTGILFGYLTQKHKDAVFTAQTYITLIIMLITGFYLEYLTNYLEYELIVPKGKSFLPTCLIAVSFTFLSAKVLEIFERRFAAFGKGVVKVIGFFGIISLELYCVQSWFADIVPLLVEDGWSKYLINPVMLLLTAATAWVGYMLFKGFWELVELLFKRPGKQKGKNDIISKTN